MTQTIVYPLEGQTCTESWTFLIGQLLPKSQYHCQGRAVVLSASGYFSHRVSLLAGMNTITIDDAHGQAVLTRVLHYAQAQSACDDFMTSADSVMPKSLCTTLVCLTPDRPLPFWVLLPKGLEVYLHLPGLARISLQECERHSDAHVFGYPYNDGKKASDAAVYVALIPAAQLPQEERLIPQLELASRSNDDKRFVTLSGEITVWSAPRLARVREDVTETRHCFPFGQRGTPQLSGTLLRVTSVMQDFAYCPDLKAWLPLSKLSLSTGPESHPINIIRSVHATQITGKNIEIDFYSDYPGAVSIQSQSSNGLTLEFGFAQSENEVIRITQEAKRLGLEHLRVTPVNETATRVEIDLNAPLWGLSLEYSAEKRLYRLSLKTKASVLSAHQQGHPLTIVLDAGHGGDEWGAMFPNGQPEKELNLHMTQVLASALREALPTARLVLSRESDMAVSLSERVSKAIASQADIVLSVHHNALPDGRDPEIERGLVTFYTAPHSEPFAWAIHSALLNASPLPDYGVSQNSLAITRPWNYLGLLLELGFVTHPEDVEQILDSSHQVCLTTAIAHAVKAFVEPNTH